MTSLVDEGERQSMNERPDPKSAIRQYFNREISLNDAVAVLDAYVPTPEPADPRPKESNSPSPKESTEAKKESTEAKEAER